MKKLYIAYGSNLNTEQMEYRCPGSKVIAKSWIYDYRLVFQGSPYGAHANIIPADGYDVPVLIWEITEYDEMALDRYEGVRGGYRTKECFHVEVNGRMRKALIYIMTPHDFGVPGDTYLDIIAEGYKTFNLPMQVLNDASIHAEQHAPIGRYRTTQSI